MNMQIATKFFLILSLLVFSFTACKKETDYIYGVDDVQVRKDVGSKTVAKSMVEFISIAYADVFGNTISQNQLGQLSLLYLSFGDKRLLEDLLIKNMLNSQLASLPSNTEMRADIGAFVRSSYLKLLNREPNELEAFTLAKEIANDPSLRVDMVYYSMMTSDEYRFY